MAACRSFNHSRNLIKTTEFNGMNIKFQMREISSKEHKAELV